MSSTLLIVGTSCTTSSTSSNDTRLADAAVVPMPEGRMVAEASFAGSAAASSTTAPSASWLADFQEPQYPTGIQRKTRIPDMTRPKEDPRVDIGLVYEKYELGKVEFRGPGGSTRAKVEDEERERVGVRLRYGEEHAGVSIDIYQEDFLGELDLYGARLGFDGRNRWIELFGKVALVADYGIGLAYQGGNDELKSDPTGTGDEVGVYYGAFDFNAGLGFEWRLLRVVGGYRGEYLRGSYGDDLGFGDLFDSEKTNGLEAFNSGAYAKVLIDLDPTLPLFVEGQAVFGDMEGFWLNAGFTW